MNRGDRVRLNWADEPTIRTVVRSGAGDTYLLADDAGGTVWVPASMIAAAEAQQRTLRTARSGGEPPPPSAAPARPTSAAGGVDAFSASAVATPPGAHARNTDPAAAHQAAALANTNVRFDTWLVLAAHIAAGEHGMTGDDFLKRTGRDYTRLGPRRPWLVDAGWVELADVKRKAKGVYRATDAGRAAWAGVAHDVRTAVLADMPTAAA